MLAKSTLLFFRLLVADLARQTGALSNTKVPLPPWDSTETHSWSDWSRVFASLDRALNPGKDEREQEFPRLFASDPFFERHCPGGDALHGALEVVTLLTHESPYESISRAYEHLLGYEPGLSAAGQAILQPSRGQRRAGGSFYTPLPIARFTVEETLRPILEEGALPGFEGQSAPQGQGGSELLRPVEVAPTDRMAMTIPRLPRIIDPAMGTGAFLLEAARYLHEMLAAVGSERRVPSSWAQGMESKNDVCRRRAMTLATIAEECLYGVDLDPLAVQLAIHALWLEIGARPAILDRHLRTGNLLNHAPSKPGNTYDAVVGNPPWGPEHGQMKTGSARKRAGRDRVDRFKLFLRLGATLSHGAVGMIVPQSVLAQSTHGDIRSFLLERFDPYSVIDLGNGAFPAAAPACALVFGPKPGPNQVHHARLRGASCRPMWSSVPRSQCTEGGFLLAGTELLDLYARLRERHPALGDLRDHIHVRDVGINYNRAAVARRVLYGGSGPDDPRDHPRFRGRDFDRYTSVRPGGWLRHDALSQLGDGEHLSLSWSTYLLPEKIILRQTADRLVATLDRSRMAMGRSVIALTAERDVSLHAVLACLNSRLLTALYRALAGEEGRLLPQVKVGRLTALPLPAMCTRSLSLDNVQDAEQAVSTALEDKNQSLLQRASSDPIFSWAALDRLAQLLLQVGGQDRRIDDLIDHLVCLSYGLTAEEEEAISTLISAGAVQKARRPARE